MPCKYRSVLLDSTLHPYALSADPFGPERAWMS